MIISNVINLLGWKNSVHILDPFFKYILHLDEVWKSQENEGQS